MTTRSTGILLTVALSALTACSSTATDDGASRATRAAETTPPAVTAAPSPTSVPVDDPVVSCDWQQEAFARRYVEAVNAADLEGIVAAFHPTGQILDVGRLIDGPEAIRSWAANEVVGGRLDVQNCTRNPDGVTLRVRFAPGGIGGFLADYRLIEREGRIGRAELTYA